MFKINVMEVKPKIMKKKNTNSSTYLSESFNLLHSKLEHANFDTLRRLINLKSISTIHIDSKHLLLRILYHKHAIS